MACSDVDDVLPLPVVVHEIKRARQEKKGRTINKFLCCHTNTRSCMYHITIYAFISVLYEVPNILINTNRCVWTITLLEYIYNMHNDTFSSLTDHWQ